VHNLRYDLIGVLTLGYFEALQQEFCVSSYHMNINIDVAVSAVLGIFTAVSGLFPRFASRGGSARESLALQNVQVEYQFVCVNSSMW
jgi:hypothetical protein